MDKKEILWKQYELSIQLYRQYLDLAIKVNMFLYAIVGALLSFYFTNKTEEYSLIILILVLVISVSFSLYFYIGSRGMIERRKELLIIKKDLGLVTSPEFLLLVRFLWIMSFFSLLIGVGVLVLLCII